MMLNKLDILKAFSTYDIFSLGWVYQDVTLTVNVKLCTLICWHMRSGTKIGGAYCTNFKGVLNLFSSPGSQPFDSICTIVRLPHNVKAHLLLK